MVVKEMTSAVLKVDSDEADSICSGIEFHSLGVAKANTLFTIVEDIRAV